MSTEQSNTTPNAQSSQNATLPGIGRGKLKERPKDNNQVHRYRAKREHETQQSPPQSENQNPDQTSAEPQPEPSNQRRGRGSSYRGRGDNNRNRFRRNNENQSRNGRHEQQQSTQANPIEGTNTTPNEQIANPEGASSQPNTQNESSTTHSNQTTDQTNQRQRPPRNRDNRRWDKPREQNTGKNVSRLFPTKSFHLFFFVQKSTTNIAQIETTEEVEIEIDQTIEGNHEMLTKSKIIIPIMKLFQLM